MTLKEGKELASVAKDIDIEKMEFIYIAGSNVNGIAAVENSLVVLQKVKYRFII